MSAITASEAIALSHIPFSQPTWADGCLRGLTKALGSGKWQGDGPLSRQCEALIRQHTGHQWAFLTPSATSALELACLAIDLQPGDEVIMPSWGFPSSANAVALRGAVPVFVDVNSDSLWMNVLQATDAITPRTKAIMPTHYAGVCEKAIGYLNDRARAVGAWVIEDAAQAYLSPYAGSGDIACYSFHATKNFGCGEGGALVTSAAGFARRAEIIREKGTDRSRFLRGEVDKYTWVDIGTSALPSEFQAAVLLPQLQQAREITEHRKALWERYAMRLTLQSPAFMGNGHIFWMLHPDRDGLIRHLKARGIQATFHFQPLHSSEAGKRYGRSFGDMNVTNRVAEQIVRLPLYHGMTLDDADRVIEAVLAF